MLKKLAEELGAAAAPAAKRRRPRRAPKRPPTPAAARTSRENPAEATFLSRRRLNARGLGEGRLAHRVRPRRKRARLRGRRFLRHLPENGPGSSTRSSPMLGAAHDHRGRAAGPCATCCMTTCRSASRRTRSSNCSPTSRAARRAKKRARSPRGEDPDGDAAHLDVLAVLQKFPGVRPHPEAFVDALEPLQPRLYSISSSPKATPGRVSLTVDAVRYLIGKRMRQRRRLDLYGRAGRAGRHG